MAHTVATVELVGGHVAIDLVNSVSWRLDPGRRVDYLADPPALATWLERLEAVPAEAAELVRGAGERTARQVLRDVQGLREHLHDALAPLADGAAPQEALVVAPELNGLLADAVAHSRLAGVPPRWQLAPTHPADVVRVLGLAALDLLTAEDLGRVRRCAGPGCGWVFLDRSKSHTRRWCSSADCGNRDRARRHYARHRAGAGSLEPEPAAHRD